MELKIVAHSDIGRVRTENQDTFLHRTDPAGVRGSLLLVADGMGGAAAGDVASRLAADTVAEVFFGGAESPERALLDAFALANGRILKAPSEGRGAAGMGTTCTALAATGERAYLAFVGDSRAYRIRGSLLTRLTSDQSVWADDVRRGGDPGHEYGRNQLTNALGVEGDMEPLSVQDFALVPGDRFLLCSDGLWGLVTDYEMLVLARHGDMDEAGRRLIALANSRGGHDNITVVLAEVAG